MTLRTLRLIRTVSFGATIAAWLFLCFAFWRHLVKITADSPEEYTRGRAFQLFNFLIQYFWLFAIALVLALAVEWAAFGVVARLSRSGGTSSG